MRTNRRIKCGPGAAGGGLFLVRASNRGRSVDRLATEGAWLFWAALALLSLIFLARPAAAEVGTAPPPPGQTEEEQDWSEEETDELPAWAEEELDEARAYEWEQDGVYVQDLEAYGSGIPSPEEVMQGTRPQVTPAPRQTPAPKVQQGPAVAREMAPPAERVVFEDFHAGLESHGRWADTPEYGRVFIPYRQTQVSGWRPYLYGQWVWTSYGWTWASDEPFGWATYHYGRWAYGPTLGWMWIPGYTWGPAWVVWRHGTGAVGWAPLYPGYLSFTASYPFFGDHWIFVAPTHFYGHPIHRHWYRDRGSYYYARSSWSRNWRPTGRGGVYAGPPRGYVQRTSPIRIHETRVVAVRSPDRRGIASRGAQPRGELRVYRPTNRGAVRPGRSDAGSSRSGIRADRAPRVGSGLGSRNLPSETRRELDRPSRTPAVRPARPGQENRSPPRGGAVRGPDSRGSDTRIPRQRPPALQPGPQPAPGKRQDRGSAPRRQERRSSSAREGGEKQLAPALPSTPRPSAPGRIAPARPSPSRSSSAGQVAPSRPSPSRPSSPGQLAPARPSTQRSSSPGQLAPARQSTTSRAAPAQQRAPARSSLQRAPSQPSPRSSSAASGLAPARQQQSRSNASLQRAPSVRTPSSSLAPAGKAAAKRQAPARGRASERR